MRLTARRLNRATLGRQLLLRREPLGAAEGVRRVVALQAQEAVSPYIALWNRLAGFDPGDLDAAFATLAKSQAGALAIGTDGFFDGQSAALAARSVRHAVPSIYQTREFAAAGGLISYGASVTDAYRLAGIYVGRILKGEKPGDLPVQQSTRIELFINLKTAKQLGLDVPPTLLARADEVIE